MQLIQAYQSLGHVKADIDPLSLRDVSQSHLELVKEFTPNNTLYMLDPKKYGFTQEDLNKEFYIDAQDMGGFLGMKKHWILKDLIAHLEKAYCGKIAVEYTHITKQEEVAWLRDRVERVSMFEFENSKKLNHFSRL